MEELIRQMIRDVRQQVTEKVPETGAFDTVYAQFENPDKGMRTTHWKLELTHSSRNYDPTERRYLGLIAYNLPSPYRALILFESGSTQDIVTLLQDEDGLVAKIKELMPGLEKRWDEVC